MKTLYQSLLDYEMALLKAIAACRSVTLTTPNHAEAVQQLSEALLSPAKTAITLADSSEAEVEALQFLVTHQGQADSGAFTRQYGPIRAMGGAKLEREQPWFNPVSPVEGLWYKGFIYKTFRVTDRGGTEFIYIPHDLLPLLQVHLTKLAPTTPDVAPSTTTFKLAPQSPPNKIVATSGRLRENMFSLLITLQTQPVHRSTDGPLSSETKAHLRQALLPPLPTTSDPTTELDFLLHLSRHHDLVVDQTSELTLNRHVARTWLKLTEAAQVYALQQCWFNDKLWNDLWHVPTLFPQPTGWSNDPLIARQKILGCLTELAPQEWFTIKEFVTTIKQVEPDFQRPQGDYSSWYIQDEAGNFLMGFANWHKVEGALIQYLLTELLPWLSIVDLGLTTAGQPYSFRVTVAGQRFLQTITQPSATPPPTTPPGDESSPGLQISPDFKVQLPADINLYDRFQLARFAQLDQRTANTISYQITPRSITQARQNGITIDQIMAFLKRVSNHQLPPIVAEGLQNWANRWGTIRLQEVVLLHLNRPELAPELRQYPDLEPLLENMLDSQTIVVSAAHAATVRHLLAELGYLVETALTSAQ